MLSTREGKLSVKTSSSAKVKVVAVVGSTCVSPRVSMTGFRLVFLNDFDIVKVGRRLKTKIAQEERKCSQWRRTQVRLHLDGF